MFAILFINIMSEQSGFCDLIDESQKYGINESQCVSPGRWHIYDINFNNIYESLVSLFVLSTLEGWPDYMYQLIDGGEPHEGPIFDNHNYVKGLFVVFIFIGSIFCVNLFVAMISLKFDNAQQKNLEKIITNDQQNWIQIVLFLISNNSSTKRASWTPF